MELTILCQKINAVVEELSTVAFPGGGAFNVLSKIYLNGYKEEASEDLILD